MHKILFILFAFFVAGCESEYYKVVKKEKQKNIRNDALFFGFHFGQTKKEFYKNCWELNKEGTVIQSDDNKYVSKILLSKDQNNTADDIEMLFYGSFNENNIMIGMNHKFRYEGWTVWSDEYNAIKLKEELIDTLQKWYPGNPFIKVNHSKLNEKIYIKIDGNRQIKMYTENLRNVIVNIEDLTQNPEY